MFATRVSERTWNASRPRSASSTPDCAALSSTFRFSWTPHLGLNFTFKTNHGDFDCIGDPGGGFDYELLKRNADHMDVAGRKVMVSSLDDLIAMKRAAGRNKDRIEVENLSALREVRDSQERS